MGRDAGLRDIRRSRGFPLDEQIRKLGSRLHVYGHQHRNRRRLYDGVWYVSNCLGYPEERRGRVIQDPGEILQSVWPLAGPPLGA